MIMAKILITQFKVVQLKLSNELCCRRFHTPNNILFPNFAHEIDNNAAVSVMNCFNPETPTSAPDASNLAGNPRNVIQSSHGFKKDIFEKWDQRSKPSTRGGYIYIRNI